MIPVSPSSIGSGGVSRKSVGGKVSVCDRDAPALTQGAGDSSIGYLDRKELLPHLRSEDRPTQDATIMIPHNSLRSFGQSVVEFITIWILGNDCILIELADGPFQDRIRENAWDVIGGRTGDRIDSWLLAIAGL